MTFQFKFQTDDRREMLAAIEKAPAGIPLEVRNFAHDAVRDLTEAQWDDGGEWIVELAGHLCAGEGSYPISTLNLRVGPAA